MGFTTYKGLTVLDKVPSADGGKALNDNFMSVADDLESLFADKAETVHTHTLAAILDAGTAAAVDVPAAGNASPTEAVLGSDSRLTDARTPTAHTHVAAEVTDFDAAVTGSTHAGRVDNPHAVTTAQIGAAATVHTHVAADVTDFDTAVTGSTHAGRVDNPHSVTAAQVGAAPAVHTHTLSAITDSGTAAALDVPASGDAAVGEVVKGDDTRLTDARTPTAHNHAATDVNSGVFDDGRVQESNVTQHEGAINHNALTNWDVTQHRIINNLGTSTIELWSASKIDAEISAILAGVDVKAGVDTTTKGVGNILLTGEQTLNGLLTSASDVLVTDQTLPEENGIYVSSGVAWLRRADADSDPEVTNGNIVHVLNSGSTKFKYKYILVSSDPIAVGTDAQDWEEHKDIDFGTTSGTAAEGNDSRILSQDENDAALGTDGAPSTSNRYVTNSDGRMTNDRDPNSHAFAGAEHSTSTLSSVNSKISDATLIDTTDSRLSDARTPTAHTHSTADVTSGTFADARIASSNVTQHEGSITHNNLTGLATGDPHTQYALLAGRTGGQTLAGSDTTAQNLTLRANTAALNGTVAISTTTVSTSSSTGALTVAGGVGVADDLFVAGDVDIGGKLTVTGLIDPTGLELTPQVLNPGAASGNTLWADGTLITIFYTGLAGGPFDDTTPETVVGSMSGAVATINLNGDNGSGTMIVNMVGQLVVGDTITGQISGATATIGSFNNNPPTAAGNGFRSEADGNISFPAYSFGNAHDSGMYWDNGTSEVTFSAQGVDAFRLSGTQAFLHTDLFMEGQTQIRANDGGNSAPSYSFTNNIDTGMYLNSSQLEFVLDSSSLIILNTSYVDISNVNTRALAINDSSGVAAIDLNAARTLSNTSGTTVVDFNSLLLSDGTNNSVDWSNRQLVNSSGSTTADWSSLFLSDGTTTIIDWSSLFLADSSGTTAVDWSNRQLSNSSGAVTVDWGSTLVLIDGSSVNSVDWGGSRILLDSSGSNSVEWASRILTDSSSGSSVNWSNRTLIDNNGTAVVDWDVINNQDGFYLTNGTSLAMDQVSAPSTPASASGGIIYFDNSDGDLKVVFANGTVATIATD